MKKFAILPKPARQAQKGDEEKGEKRKTLSIPTYDADLYHHNVSYVASSTGFSKAQ